MLDLKNRTVRETTFNQEETRRIVSHLGMGARGRKLRVRVIAVDGFQEPRLGHIKGQQIVTVGKGWFLEKLS